VTILALDTTSNVASVAVRAHGRLAAKATIHSSSGFGHLIFSAIEECLSDARVDLKAVDCFAAGSGPGSFTGLRIGLAAVKGLAEATQRPAIGISNLRALSSCARQAASLRAVFLDARRGEVYGAVYNPGLQIVMPEMVLRFEAWLAKLDAGVEYEFISSAPLPVEETRFAGMPFTLAPQTLAAAVAVCAERDGRAGAWQESADLDANYVRRSDAELFWREN